MASVVEILIRARDQYSNTLNKADKHMRKLVATGTALTGAGLAITGALVAMAQKTAEAGDEFQKTALRTGLTTEELSALKFAVEQSGSSFDGLANGLRTMARNANEAAQGTATQRDAFDALGLSATGASGELRPMNEILLEAADRFSVLTNDTEAAALAQDIFGRSGVELLPFLKQGRDGIEALTVQAADLGIVYGTGLADASANLIDAQNELKSAMAGISREVAETVIPAMVRVVDAITPWITRLRELIDAHPGLVKAIGALGVALIGAGGIILGIAGVSAALTILGAAGGPIFLVIAAVAAIVAGFFAFRAEITGALLFALSRAVEGFAKFVGFAARLADAVGLDGVAGKLNAMRQSVVDTAEKLDEMSNDALTPATRETEEFTAASRDAEEQTIDLADALEKSTDEANDNAKALEEIKNAAEDFEDRVASLTGSVYGNVKSAAELEEALRRLKGQSLPLELVTKNLGRAVLDTADEMRALGVEVPDNIAHYEDLIRTSAELEERTQDLEEAQLALNRSLEEGAIELASVELAVDPLSQSHIQLALEVGRASAELDRMRGSVGAVENKIIALRNAGLSNNGIIAVMGDEISRVRGTAEQLGEALGPSTTGLIGQIEAMEGATEKSKDGWVDWRDAVTDAVGDALSSFSAGMSGLILESGKAKDKIVGIFKNLARTIIEIFTANVFGRLTSEFAGFLSGIGGNGLLGGLARGLGGMLGGTASGGVATSLSQLGPGAVGPVASGAGTGAGLTALLTNPITAAIGGALAAGFAIFKGQAHHKADEWVQTFQNPFDKAISDALTGFWATAESGELTVEAATEARHQVASLWAAYQQSADEFAQRGGDHVQVIRQAMQTAREVYGAGFSKIFSDMDQTISRLTAAAAGLTTSLDAAIGAAGDAGRAISAAFASLPPAPAEAAEGMKSIEPLDSFQFGADRVPRTGLYELHAGEAVVPASSLARLDRIEAMMQTMLGRSAEVSLELDGHRFARLLVPFLNDGVERAGLRMVASETA